MSHAFNHRSAATVARAKDYVYDVGRRGVTKFTGSQRHVEALTAKLTFLLPTNSPSTMISTNGPAHDLKHSTYYATQLLGFSASYSNGVKVRSIAVAKSMQFILLTKSRFHLLANPM